MTVCDQCKQLFDGLADICPDCRWEYEKDAPEFENEICTNCGGSGLAGHDCGEDSCCCLYPEDNMLCFYCEGAGTLPVTEESK